MKISSRSIEEVRERANIVEVASEFTALRRQGTNLVGLCPYHSEKSPSFSVSPEKNFYYCFGCKKGGDAIKLITELKSFSFVEAVSYLAERFGVELTFEGYSPEEERSPSNAPLGAVRRIKPWLQQLLTTTSISSNRRRRRWHDAISKAAAWRILL